MKFSKYFFLYVALVLTIAIVSILVSVGITLITDYSGFYECCGVFIILTSILEGGVIVALCKERLRDAENDNE